MKNITPLSTLSRFLKILPFLVLLLPTLALANNVGFDYPAGKPDGIEYTRGEKEGGWDGWGFLEWNDSIWHPGEDWNRGGGETDFGDPLYSVAVGRVVKARDYKKGWGKIVLIEHDLGANGKVWSQYAHLSNISVQEGDAVLRGDLIGNIGNADGKWASHLHFEIRKVSLSADYWPSSSKDEVNNKYNNPSTFINSHRPVVGQTLTAIQNQTKVELSWTKAEGADFDKSIVYRSGEAGGTAVDAKRTKIFETTDATVLSATDQSPPPGATAYYRIYTYYKNGQVGESQEVAVAMKVIPTKITDNPSDQRDPVIDGDYVYWQDSRLIDGKNNQRIFFYNIKTGESGSGDIRSSGAQFVETPEAASGIVAFAACEGAYCSTGRNIYVYNTQTKMVTPISKAARDQFDPAISKEGIVVWTDLRNGGNLDLYYLDLNKADGETPFVLGAGNQRAPRIWGNKVVWKDSRTNTNYDLYIKEIGGTESVLATSAGDSAPGIWENWVVWDYKGKVTLMNLADKTTRMISETNGWNPKVRDGKVVYVKSEGTVSYLHVYAIAAGTDTKIDFVLNYQSTPTISGDVIVFNHSEKQTVPNMDIYLTRL